MIGIISYAPCKAFVIRVIGILLIALLIDVVRIAVRPSDDGVSALVTQVLNGLCHAGSFCVERVIQVQSSSSGIVPEVPA
jgi:fluoride ion exporter CrcB/FEX